MKTLSLDQNRVLTVPIIRNTQLKISNTPKEVEKTFSRGDFYTYLVGALINLAFFGGAIYAFIKGVPDFETMDGGAIVCFAVLFGPIVAWCGVWCLLAAIKTRNPEHEINETIAELEDQLKWDKASLACWDLLTEDINYSAEGIQTELSNGRNHIKELVNDDNYYDTHFVGNQSLISLKEYYDSYRKITYRAAFYSFLDSLLDAGVVNKVVVDGKPVYVKNPKFGTGIYNY